MAERARKRRPKRAAAPSGRGRALLAEIGGLSLVALALLSALAVWSHDATDPAFRLEAVSNRAGVVGASLSWLLLGLLGSGTWVLLAGVLIVGGRLLLRRGLPHPTSRFWVAGLALGVSLSTLSALLVDAAPGLPLGRGGWLGNRLAATESLLLHRGGALLLNGLALGFGALGIFGIAPGTALAALGRGLGAVGRGLARAWAALGAAAGALGAGVAGASGRAWRAAAGAVSGGVQSATVWRAQRARRKRLAAMLEPEKEEIPEAAATPAPEAPPRPAPRRRGEAPDIVDHRDQGPRSRPEQEEFAFHEKRSAGPFELPDVSLFQRPPGGPRSYDRDSLIMNSRILEKKLQDFGVSGRVVTVHPGPVITMYEYEPASGIKVNRIVNLADDLALALRALSVRIIAPIPGKSVVGIEVPNPEREVVYIRDLLESKSFRHSESPLTLALGKDIFGNPKNGDLARMPHLLVAGATGTGKSVFLNSLLCSILCRATPDEVKLLLIDPKLLELSIYEGIPHLIADVVTNPKRAAAALQGIVHKMEERYQRMAALGVRNIAQYNERVDKALSDGDESFRLKKKPGEEEGKEVAYERLPYIVVVIDELADLMVVSARDVEESLQRLAQMARASGIHLVLATQRPSVDVLTGIIKANFPSRISFQVSSRTDSRTILDHNGAEHLLGQGDMLFLPPGTSRLERLHGSYVSEEEVTELVRFLREQGQPEFDEDLLRIREENDAREERGEEVDELYDRAVAIVAETRNASISYVQRRLKVGYNRAARMIEQMEIEGVIGPQEGTKPREVYAQPVGPDLVD